jgi:membrane fusion protein, multidrug efflux system
MYGVRYSCALFFMLVFLVSTSAQGEGLGNDNGGVRTRTLVVAAKEAVISSQMAGRITELRDQLGSTFSKGQRLVTFDCAELNGRLKMAEAEQESARLTLDAKKELLKFQSAGETEVALASVAYDKATAQVELSRAQVSYCAIDAPFDGVVVKVVARPFQSVTQGQVLIEIVSRGNPKAKMNVPSRWLSWLKPGTPFRFTADETGRSYAGSITFINGRVDAVSQTTEAEGSFASANGLTAGMSGYSSLGKATGRR